MVSNPQLHEWLTEQLGLFTRDPATTEFQKGYLTALVEVANRFKVAQGAASAVLHQLPPHFDEERPFPQRKD